MPEASVKAEIASREDGEEGAIVTAAREAAAVSDIEFEKR